MQHPLTNVQNFRDLSHASSILRPGILYRSAHLDTPSRSDTSYLSQTLGIRTLLDLRSPSIDDSHQEEAQGENLPHPFKIISIPLITRQLELHWVYSLSWWMFIWFFILALFKQKFAMVQLLGKEVLGPRGLGATLVDSLEISSAKIVEVLKAMSDETLYPMVYHCQYGKDRTGILSIVLLRLLGASWEDVERDYQIIGGDEWKKMVRHENVQLHLGTDFDEAPLESVRLIRGWFEGQGGVEKWCDKVGFTETEREKLREVLTGKILKGKVEIATGVKYDKVYAGLVEETRRRT